jgi:putative copper export protein
VIPELLVAALRLAHALSAAVWVGGTLAFALVDQPARAALGPGAWRAFREALRIGIGVFVLTGGIMTVERLGSAALPPTYFGVLAVKIGLGIWMFALARRIGSASLQTEWWRRPEASVIGLGVVVYGLAIALKSIYEDALRFRG